MAVAQIEIYSYDILGAINVFAAVFTLLHLTRGYIPSQIRNAWKEEKLMAYYDF